MSLIGGAVSAFLNVQASVSMKDSIHTLQYGQSWTRDQLLKPMVTAVAQTGEHDDDP